MRKQVCWTSLILSIIVVAWLGGLLWRDTREELRQRFAQTEAAWQKASICMQQRNALLALGARLTQKHDLRRQIVAMRTELKNHALPTPNIILQERALQRESNAMIRALSGEEKHLKLADLLAAHENRAALMRLYYDKKAARMKAFLQTFSGRCLGRLLQVPEPVPFTPGKAS